MNSSNSEQSNNRQPMRSCAPQNLEEIMEYLHLTACLKNYKSVLETAAKENLSIQEALLRLLSLESCAKFERQILARINQAKFPQVKTLDTFDFNFPSSIPKQKILAATQLSFIDNAGGLVFIGPTGVGKTHLANAIGHIKAGAAHYEFVRIHPFMDGNGRVVRALCMLVLLASGYDVRKLFALEEYYESDRNRYYEALESAQKNNDNMTGWLEYFAGGMAFELERVKGEIEQLQKGTKNGIPSDLSGWKPRF